MRTPLFLMVLLSVLTGLSVRADAAATHVLGAKMQTLDPSTDTVDAGYYLSATLSAVDTDLVPSNIKSGVTIFGKLGTYATGYLLPDTGQTTSYTATFGEDHDYQPAITQPSFTDNADGTITDNRTGLMWAKDGTAAGCNGGTPTTWEEAGAFCQNLTFASYTDWRLPSVREFMSILNYQNYGPTINAGNNWTSTTVVANTATAWTIFSTNGEVAGSSAKTNAGYIRCVRGGL